MDTANTKTTTRLRNQKTVDLSTMVYGKVPPQVRELEEAVLGAILHPAGGIQAFERAAEILHKPECFYSPSNALIFGACRALYNKNRPLDIQSVVEELRTREELDVVGGPYYVTKLTNTVVSSASIEHHSRIIYQKFLQRELIRVCGETLSEAYEDSTDVFETIEEHEKSLTEITLSTQTKEMTGIEQELVRAIQELEVRRLNDDHITGIPSGFPALDAVTHGWQKTDLIILAARPSVGKTALAIQFARNAAVDPKPKATAFFSLEMSTGQLVQRLLSAESEIPLEKIATGRMDDADMEKLYRKAIQRLSEHKIYFDDTPALNISQLRAKCRKLKRKIERESGGKQTLELIVIDYLQLMSGLQEGKAVAKSGNREQEISHISRSLKALAKELNVPIIALSQMSREVEKRKDFEPMLSDLRESGAIEQDADMVVFIYRPEYHGATANEMGESTTGETILKIAKHRNGKLEKVKLTAQLWIQKFIAFEGAAQTGSALPANWKPIGTRQSADDDIIF